MFTGLIQAVGVVVRADAAPAGLRLAVNPAGWDHHPKIGDSIAVNGCCLTVAAAPAASGGLLVFDAVPETLAKTTLGSWRAGTRVNLEHAATPTTLLGGHLVQGHVDGVARVEAVMREGTGEFGPRRVRFRAPAGVMPYLAPKGSVCVEGVSLTLAGVNAAAGEFEVALIPTTLEKTTLGSLGPGAACNVEADTIAKTIVHYLRHYGPG